MNSSLFTDLSSPLALASGGYSELDRVRLLVNRQDSHKSCIKKKKYAGSTQHAMPTASFNPHSFIPTPSPGQETDRVMILPVTGLMTKYAQEDYWWFSPGIDDIAEAIQQAEQIDEIRGTILLFNTYGGSTQSWIRIEEVLRNRQKPVVAAVDGMCASAGVYVAALCDKIVALNTTCKIGSIGVMAQLTDTTEAEKQRGIRIIELYPPESKFKNLPEREALSGKEKRLIEEELSPLARHFRQHIISQRPELDQTVEGLLEGKIFFAEEAVSAGLIDKICTLQQTIQLVEQLAQTNDEIRKAVL